jgi:hypothetical protein
MDDRTGRPEQIMAPALRSIIKRIDLAIENGSLDPKDRDEVIKMFISGPTTVVDNKQGGGMMNMDEMIRPLGYEVGGVVPRSRQQSVMEEEAKPQSGMFSGLMSLIKNIRENAFAPEQREDGGAEYMKMFNFLWGKGYSQPQIDAILSGEINQEDVVPERENLDEKFKG